MSLLQLHRKQKIGNIKQAVISLSVFSVTVDLRGVSVTLKHMLWWGEC